MGYTTEFFGRFELNKPLTPGLFQYLSDFAESRHYNISPELIMKIDKNWNEHCYLGDLGQKGQYYLTKFLPDYDIMHMSGDLKEEILKKGLTCNYNQTPEDVPGLWCQWIPSDDNMGIEWDGGEKFYEYIAWIKFLIEHFLAPNGYVVSGSVRWRGESFDDIGVIEVENNVVHERGIEW